MSRAAIYNDPFGSRTASQEATFWVARIASPPCQANIPVSESEKDQQSHKRCPGVETAGENIIITFPPFCPMSEKNISSLS
ncbi:hypothetical protein OIU79_029759 [Salix purpurea]|uniref:Uncharacterized protein n=1 Tax=Salix purpurea TaxID=77065 RepID=A0A9Q0VHV5_SALPP|nr:hypothetical protein OIU79_029759 [Salix purpurea]